MQLAFYSALRNKPRIRFISISQQSAGVVVLIMLLVVQVITAIVRYVRYGSGVCWIWARQGSDIYTNIFLNIFHTFAVEGGSDRSRIGLDRGWIAVGYGEPYLS